jgi:hypothetical protein
MAWSTCCVDPAIFLALLLVLKKLLALRYLAAQIRQRRLQILVRVDRRVSNANLVVQVGAGTAATVADVADHMTAKPDMCP